MMDAPLSDRSRNAAGKLLLIAAALMPALGTDAIAQDYRRFFLPTPSPTKDADLANFLPVLSPIEDADPAIRHNETIQVPTRLVFVQWESQLMAGVDKEGFKPVEVSVGLKMILGTRYNVIVYPVTEPRPAKKDNNGEYMMSGVNKGTMMHWIHPISSMLPSESNAVSGRQYNVELNMEVFETNLPPQHMWMPQGHEFKVLFSQTIKGIITPKP